MARVTKTFVFLKATDVKKSVSKKFEINLANQLLKFPNSKWVLDDVKFKFNGTEIVKIKEKDIS